MLQVFIIPVCSTSSTVIDVTGLSAAGSHSDEESKTNERKRWLSIYVMFFTMFLGAVSELFYIHS